MFLRSVHFQDTFPDKRDSSPNEKGKLVTLIKRKTQVMFQVLF